MRYITITYKIQADLVMTHNCEMIGWYIGVKCLVHSHRLIEQPQHKDMKLKNKIAGSLKIYSSKVNFKKAETIYKKVIQYNAVLRYFQ